MKYKWRQSPSPFFLVDLVLLLLLFFLSTFYPWQEDLSVSLLQYEHISVVLLKECSFSNWRQPLIVKS